jgi:hypothetical protein
MTTETKALPERHRQARNINEGMEVWDGTQERWIEVTSALHILSPMAVSTFTLADGRELSGHPNTKIMTRRLAS